MRGLQGDGRRGRPGFLGRMLEEPGEALNANTFRPPCQCTMSVSLVSPGQCAPAGWAAFLVSRGQALVSAVWTTHADLWQDPVTPGGPLQIRILEEQASWQVCVYVCACGRTTFARKSALYTPLDVSLSHTHTHARTCTHTHTHTHTLWQQDRKTPHHPDSLEVRVLERVERVEREAREESRERGCVCVYHMTARGLLQGRQRRRRQQPHHLQHRSRGRTSHPPFPGRPSGPTGKTGAGGERKQEPIRFLWSTTNLSPYRLIQKGQFQTLPRKRLDKWNIWSRIWGETSRSHNLCVLRQLRKAVRPAFKWRTFFKICRPTHRFVLLLTVLVRL